VSLVEEFFQAIDRAWPSVASPKVRLSAIGSGALMLQVSYERGTKDSDVLETIDLSSETKARLVNIAGPGTLLHQQWKLYLDVVGNGIPLVPHDELIARFRSAVDIFSYDARADDLPKYVEHLHRVERDMLDVDETEIELPPWI
jgi:hypothetical protein